MSESLSAPGGREAIMATATETTLCIYCSQEMHFLCNRYGKCCCERIAAKASANSQTTLNLGPEPKPEPIVVPVENDDKPKRKAGRPKKSETGEKYKNQVMAGRMYANRNIQIKEGDICDWAWKSNCGGGNNPILGCSGRAATERHHGPDKSTGNNSPENIHRICSYCHNLWHARNDKSYPPGRPEDGTAWLPIGFDPSIHLPNPVALEDTTSRTKVILQESELDRPDIDWAGMVSES